MTFLPPEYKAPKSSGFYMKFQEGENKFRILSRPILGWEDWQERTPVRYTFDDKPSVSYDPKKPVKHFWSMVVWNYGEEQIQILHITQASIRNAIETLSLDSDWGAPYFYDIKVIKRGEGKETEYSVVSLPHRPTAAHIRDAFNERRCNLNALFINQDPFAPNQKYTEGVFDEKSAPSASLTGTVVSLMDAVDELRELLAIEEMGAEHLDSFLAVIATKRSSTVAESAQYVLTLPPDTFVAAYKKHASEQQSRAPLSA